MLKDKSKNVFESGMHLDSALNCVSEAAYILGREDSLPDSVYRNLSAARNALEAAMDGLEQMPDTGTFDLLPAISAAREHEALVAEVNAHNLRITQQANAMVNDIVDSLTDMFSKNNLNISVARKYHTNERDTYYHVHTIEGVCRNNYSAVLIRVMISGQTRHTLSNGRLTPRHDKVEMVLNDRVYSSLNECLAATQNNLTTLIIESYK